MLNPNIALPLVYNTHSPPTPPSTFSNPFAPLFLSFTPSSCVFPLFSLGGLLGAAVRCSVEQNGVEVEVGKERRIL